MKKNIFLLSVALCFLSVGFQHAMEPGEGYAAASSLSKTTYFPCVDQAAKFLREKTNNALPKLLMVLTAGVEAPKLEDEQEVLYAEIPHFPIPKVKGHEGKLVFGKLDGVEVVLMKGRFHYYEGHEAYAVVFPYFVLQELGVQALITVNTVGGLSKNLDVGDVMLVTDQDSSRMPQNPLRIISTQAGRPFVDMVNAYDSNYRELAREIAKQEEIELKEGVLGALQGPNFETPVECKSLRNLGWDAVGMSTVWEVMVCRWLGVKVLAFCGISNVSADRATEAIAHEDNVKVMEEQVGPNLYKLMLGCAKKIIDQNL